MDGKAEEEWDDAEEEAEAARFIADAALVMAFGKS